MVKIILFFLLSLTAPSESPFIPVVARPNYIAAFTWNEVSDSRLLSYELSWGTSEKYDNKINVGKVNTVLVGGFSEGTVYHASVTYNIERAVSGPSKNYTFSYVPPPEVSKMHKDLDKDGKVIYNLVVEEKSILESIPKIKLNTPVKIR